jgi:hypothetical protein
VKVILLLSGPSPRAFGSDLVLNSTQGCFCVNRLIDAEDSNHPVRGRAGNAGEAAPAPRGFVHPFECAERGGLQAALLREQELLRYPAEKHDADFAAALQKR